MATRNATASTEVPERDALGRPRAAGLGWALRRSIAITAGKPVLWALGVAGFLVRGGLVLYAVPILVLPTPIGIATFLGPDAVTPAGLSVRLAVLAATTVVALTLAVLLGSLVAATVDSVAIGLVLDSAPPGSHALARSARAGAAPVGRLLSIRLACLVPVALVALAALPRIGEAGYREVILPSDLAVPYVIRVLQAAWPTILLLAAAVVLAEVLGGIAVRHAVIEDTGAFRSLGSALGQVVRHPLSTLLVFGLTTAVGIAVIASGLVAVDAAWGQVTGTAAATALVPSTQFVLAIEVALLIVVWSSALALAGVAAGWRGALWTLEVVRHRDHQCR